VAQHVGSTGPMRCVLTHCRPRADSTQAQVLLWRRVIGTNSVANDC
jgi:hypothetical protein